MFREGTTTVFVTNDQKFIHLQAGETHNTMENSKYSARGGSNKLLGTEDIRIQLINIRSIRKNLANYMATLYADNVGIIVLTETWLSK